MESRKGILERQAGCDNEGTARDKRLLVAGRGACGRGLKEGHFNQVVRKGDEKS